MGGPRGCGTASAAAATSRACPALRQFPGQHRGCERLEIGLSRSLRIVGLKAFGGREQESGSVAPPFGSKGHPGSEHIKLCLLKVVHGTSFSTRGESQRGLEGAGLPLGFGGRERSNHTLVRTDRQFSRPL